MKIKLPVIEFLYNEDKIKLTNIQWKLYYYLVSISKHNFISKQDFKKENCCKVLNTNLTTYYKTIKALTTHNLITIYSDAIIINDIMNNYVKIELSVLKVLLYFSKNTDLIKLYLIFLKYGDSRVKHFTKNKIIEMLGHAGRNNKFYPLAQNYLDILQNLKLIDLTVEEKKCCGKSYNSYIVNKVYETNDYFKSDKLSEILSNIPDEIKEKYIQGPSD